MNEHAPMAVEMLGRQDQNCGEQNSRIPTRNTALPSHCRDPFPLHGGSASLRRIGRRQTDARECSGNFFRRSTDVPGRRKGSVRISREVIRPSLESVRIICRRKSGGNIVAAGFSGARYLGLQVLLFCSLNLALDSPALWVRPKVARTFSG